LIGARDHQIVLFGISLKATVVLLAARLRKSMPE